MSEKGTKPPDHAAWAAALKHRPNYKLNVAEYAGVFGVKERGVKKWIAKARADWLAAGCPSGGPDFPPLDDPAKMLAWRQAHMEREPPVKFLELAGGAAAVIAPVAAAMPDATPAKPAVSPRTAVHLADITEMDLAGGAVTQRKVLAAAAQAYTAALADPSISESTLTLLAKRYDEAFERLRKVDDSLAAAEQKRGNMVHVDLVRAEILPILQTLANSLPNELVQQLGIDRVRARLFCDRWFRHLVGTRFIDGLALSSAPTTAAA